MKTLKQKLIFLATLILTYPLVILGFRISSLSYILILVFVPFFIHSLLPKTKTLIIRIIFGVFIAAYGLFSFFSLLRFALCGYGPTNEKYVNRSNSNLKIVGRDFSCFGTTGDLVLYHQYSITAFLKAEIYYKTSKDYKEDIKVDTSIWRPLYTNYGKQN